MKSIEKECFVFMTFNKFLYIPVCMWVCVFYLTNMTIFFNGIVWALRAPSPSLEGTHFTQVYNPDDFHNGKKSY